MKPHVLAALPLLVWLGACSRPATESAYDADLKTLQGTWRPVSMEQDGEMLSHERIGKIRLTLEGKHFTFATPGDSHSGEYRIDPAKNPKQLDIAVQTGDEAGKVYLVIYKFEGGKMIQCMQVDNAKRPSEFSGAAGSGNLLEIWEKQ